MRSVPAAMATLVPRAHVGSSLRVPSQSMNGATAKTATASVTTCTERCSGVMQAGGVTLASVLELGRLRPCP